MISESSRTNVRKAGFQTGYEQILNSFGFVFGFVFGFDCERVCVFIRVRLDSGSYFYSGSGSDLHPDFKNGFP